jgi:hypothetical protein
MLTAERQMILESPMPNARRQNRETFTRLFQGFVNEYGEADAKKIIKHLIDEACGVRMWVPAPGPDPLSRCSPSFRRLWRSVCNEFGRASGRAIMNKIMVEVGSSCSSRRISFPDYKDLCIWERNEIIKTQLACANSYEVAHRWGMSRQWVLRIGRGEEN